MAEMNLTDLVQELKDQNRSNFEIERHTRNSRRHLKSIQDYTLAGDSDTLLVVEELASLVQAMTNSNRMLERISYNTEVPEGDDEGSSQIAMSLDRLSSFMEGDQLAAEEKRREDQQDSEETRTVLGTIASKIGDFAKGIGDIAKQKTSGAMNFFGGGAMSILKGLKSIGKLFLAGGLIYILWETFKMLSENEEFKAVLENLKKVFNEKVVPTFNRIVEAVKPIVAEVFTSAVDNLAKGITDLVDGITKIMDGDIFGGIKTIFVGEDGNGGLVNSLIDFIVDAINSIFKTDIKFDGLGKLFEDIMYAVETWIMESIPEEIRSLLGFQSRAEKALDGLAMIEEEAPRIDAAIARLEEKRANGIELSKQERQELDMMKRKRTAMEESRKQFEGDLSRLNDGDVATIQDRRQDLLDEAADLRDGGIFTEASAGDIARAEMLEKQAQDLQGYIDNNQEELRYEPTAPEIDTGEKIETLNKEATELKEQSAPVIIQDNSVKNVSSNTNSSAVIQDSIPAARKNQNVVEDIVFGA